MVNFIKDKLRRPYYLLKHNLSDKPTLEFDYDSLPLVDKNVSLDEVLKNIEIPADTPYNLREKLEFWRENGYVVLENVLPKNSWHELKFRAANRKKSRRPKSTFLIRIFETFFATILVCASKSNHVPSGKELNNF